MVTVTKTLRCHGRWDPGWSQSGTAANDASTRKALISFGAIAALRDCAAIPGARPLKSVLKSGRKKPPPVNGRAAAGQAGGRWCNYEPCSFHARVGTSERGRIEAVFRADADAAERLSIRRRLQHGYTMAEREETVIDLTVPPDLARRCEINLEERFPWHKAAAVQHLGA